MRKSRGTLVPVWCILLMTSYVGSTLNISTITRKVREKQGFTDKITRLVGREARVLSNHGYDFVKVKHEVESYQDVVNDIINLSVNGAAKGQSYNRLAEFTDKFGSRIAGSRNLESAIDYMLDRLSEEGLESVHGEKAMVPHWVRGNESAVMLEPRLHPLPMLGLGSSISTPSQGIQAEVLVVRSFDELKSQASRAKGKIVVFNQKWVSYGVSVQYRSQGATEAAKVGAVASLIRSVTPLSIDSPHTGWQDYQENITKIPTACITVEDAEMMWRMSQRGERIVVRLKMEAQNLPEVESRNTVAEIRGSKFPDEVVLVSGHLDSWDVGQGAMDDGGGAFISWQALSLIRQLNLRPKRTLRAVLWTAEEEGTFGAASYWKQHQQEVNKMDFVMESDEGTFTPNGIAVTGNKETVLTIKQIVKLLAKINATTVLEGQRGEDILYWTKEGVPGGSLLVDDRLYSYFHHTNGDTMTVQNSRQMDLCSAVWATVAYVVADLEDMLPR